jgi:hypothetical protein
MAASDRPPVEERLPPALLLKFGNPLVKAVLRSPFHRLLSKQAIVLTVTGRRSGREYEVPVGRHQSGDTLTVLAEGQWRLNLRGGATVGVTVDGRHHTVETALEEDPEVVARAYLEQLQRVGLRRANRLGLKVHVDRMPTVDELKPAVAGHGIARITLNGPAA